ncbi:hypothetical protein ACLOJK_022189 [Asimina triloba]
MSDTVVQALYPSPTASDTTPMVAADSEDHMDGYYKSPPPYMWASEITPSGAPSSSLAASECSINGSFFIDDDEAKMAAMKGRVAASFSGAGECWAGDLLRSMVVTRRSYHRTAGAVRRRCSAVLDLRMLLDVARSADDEQTTGANMFSDVGCRWLAGNGAGAASVWVGDGRGGRTGVDGLTPTMLLQRRGRELMASGMVVITVTSAPLPTDRCCRNGIGWSLMGFQTTRSIWAKIT